MDLEKQTKKIMLEAIKRYAKENDVSSERVQLLIYTDNSELEPKYKVMVDNKELKKVSFNDILNVKLDFLGREMIATPFITNTINKLMRESECEYNEVNVLVYPKEKELNLYFFVGTKPNKPIDLKYVFNELN
jgi:hypothetical protein|tara:strand:- start:2691 stop:3089 length:399 start_codon:yes stop_codon:yes gene_type:complete